jgi:mycofactocin system FadH/OYE family oxidoreductase 2
MSTNTQFTHLFRPIQLGPVTVPNRVCFSAHAAMYAEDGLPSERQVHYYGERAKGGVGLIVIGGSGVHESSKFSPHFNIVSDERAIPGYRRIADRVHEYGTKIFSQADHYAVLELVRSYRGPTLSPSAVPDLYSPETPKEMELEDIEMILAATTKAAHVLQASGFDGIEFGAAQGIYGMHKFLSPVFNKRTDEYGGSLENRCRFLIRVFEAARKVVGSSMCIGLKLVGDEFTPGGMGVPEIQEAAKYLAATGYLDYIHVCAGSSYSLPVTVPEMSFPLGCAVHLAAAVREVVGNVPVLAVKRINDPVLAEKILADGQADMVAMARPLIADPELVKKAREGRLEDLRQCTGVNQDCIGRITKHGIVRCIQNPAAGEEGTLGAGTLQPAARKKKVVVVGGGPAGLKVAEIAARRGHEVVLYEKGDELGGQILSIIKVASRKDFENIIRYLRLQIRKLGVRVTLGREVSAEDILKEGADTVVIATGSVPVRTGYSPVRPDVEKLAGVTQDNVKTVVEVFGDGSHIGQRVVVIDEFGDMEATMTAEYLADQGKEVEIVTRQPFVGVNIEPFSFDPQMERLADRKVVFTPFTVVTEISGTTLQTFHPYARLERRIENVDTVVLMMGKRANDGLYFALKGKVPELHRIGDCLAPRKVSEAIWEGETTARAI